MRIYRVMGVGGVVYLSLHIMIDGLSVCVCVVQILGVFNGYNL